MPPPPPSTEPSPPTGREQRSRAAGSEPPAIDSGTHGVTDLLLAWGAGDRGALEALMPLLHAELRRQARRALRHEVTGHTLQPTELVHEAFLRLVDQSRARWESRTQFFAVAAEVMRRVLVDHARARRAAKRGGGVRHMTLGAVGDAHNSDVEAADDVDVLALHEALTRFAALDPRKARLVELRYFAGLSIPEAATVLGVSPATIGRDWAVARLWLKRELHR